MLMDIKCAAVTSIAVHLVFDDHSVKDRVVSEGDLVYVEYNANGMRRSVEGNVVKISAVGTDPNGWYIIVDGSDDFNSARAKFSPMSILDLEVLRKAASTDIVHTPVGDESVPFLRIKKGRLQWSKDGYNWHSILMDRRDIIEDQEGTVPVNPAPPIHGDMNTTNSSNSGCGCDSDDAIEDANW